ncbi:flagellar biosynthesis protein FlhA, partial [Klebsiella quasipneumoniae]
MPNFVFLFFTAALAGLGWYILKRHSSPQVQQQKELEQVEKQNRVVEASWEDVQLEDPLSMEVGYRLIPMVDNRQNGELLGR